MPFDKRAYDMEYARQNIKRIHVPFNQTVPEDVEIMEWLNKQPNRTQYIKTLILEDMRSKKADS